MKTVKELLEPVTSRGLDLMVLVDTWDFQRFYESEEFFDKLKTGVGLQEGSSILTLQRKLIADGNSRKKFTTKDKTILLATAWNLFVQGKTGTFNIKKELPKLVDSTGKIVQDEILNKMA